MSSKRVAIQGENGSYSHAAATGYFTANSSLEIEIASCSTVAKLCVEVTKGDSDYAVVPIENSKTGSMSTVFDLMMKHGLYIVGEWTQEEKHCLVGIAGATKEGISEVVTHGGVLEQVQSQ